MSDEELPPPEPIWGFRLWSLLHAISAVAFIIFVIMIPPSRITTLMAFIVGVNITQARTLIVMGNLIARGNRQVAALKELKEAYERLAAAAEAIDTTDRQQ